MSAYARNKGRRGQLALARLLSARDWSVAELNSGTACEDFIAVDPDGKSWAVEVKNTAAITKAHRQQAMRQAKARRLPWLLASKIADTACWLVQRQGQDPVVWRDADG